MIDSDDATKEAASKALHDLYEDAYEDNDFLELYSLDDSDEIADLDGDGQLGMTDLRFRFWFVPFGSGVDRGVPHPFVLDSEPKLRGVARPQGFCLNAPDLLGPIRPDLGRDPAGPPPLAQGRSLNVSMCSGRTMLKCRWSSVAMSAIPRRSATAITEASTLPSGRSWYRATSSAILNTSAGWTASSVKLPEAKSPRKRTSGCQPSRLASR